MTLVKRLRGLARIQKALAAERDVGPSIRVCFADSVTEGGCNFCDRHVTAHGEGAHRVAVVSRSTGGGVHVRFCSDCLNELQRCLEDWR